jgi:hypothetical protein
MTKDRNITCPLCGRTSWHPMDVKERYCGACHKWHDQFTTTELLGALAVVMRHRDHTPHNLIVATLHARALVRALKRRNVHFPFYTVLGDRHARD